MRAFFLLLTLAACGASPGPQYFGATRHEVTRGGINFVVFQKGNEAEVVRLGYLSRARRDAVPQLMIEAVEDATACRAIPGSMTTGLPGDTGVARFDLDC